MGGGLPVTVEPAQLRGSCRRCSSGVQTQPPRPILSVLRASASAGWVGGCCGSAALTSSISLSRPTQWEPERCDGCRPQPADDESRKDVRLSAEPTTTGAARHGSNTWDTDQRPCVDCVGCVCSPRELTVFSCSHGRRPCEWRTIMSAPQTHTRLGTGPRSSPRATAWSRVGWHGPGKARSRPVPSPGPHVLDGDSKRPGCLGRESAVLRVCRLRRQRVAVGGCVNGDSIKEYQILLFGLHPRLGRGRHSSTWAQRHSPLALSARRTWL